MTEDNNTILNFEDALKVIDAISDSFHVDIWIPSAKKEFKFKEIDAKQQKKMLSSAMNSSVYNTNFIKTFYDILKENVLSEGGVESIDNFTIFDKYAIAVALKNKISDETSVVFDEKKEIVKKIKLNTILNNFKEFNTPENAKLGFKTENLYVEVEVSVPTIGNELKYEEEIHKKEKKIDDIKNSDDIQKIVSDAFIGETSKYIKNISVNDVNINFDSFDYNKKIKIVEKLPSGIIQRTIEVISNWKKQIDSVLTVYTTENDVEYKKVLTIDSLLFLN